MTDPSHRPVPSVRQKQTRSAVADRIQVLERYLAGETANVLADAFLDVNRATIFAILPARRHRVSPTGILTNPDIAAATAMYETGQSQGLVAAPTELLEELLGGVGHGVLLSIRRSLHAGDLVPPQGVGPKR